MLSIFSSFLTIYIFSLEKSLFRSSAYFLIGLLSLFWYWAAYAICIFGEINSLSVIHLQIFSPILSVVFSFCLRFPLLYKYFCLIMYDLFIFVFIFITLSGGSIKILVQQHIKMIIHHGKMKFIPARQDGFTYKNRSM